MIQASNTSRPRAITVASRRNAPFIRRSKPATGTARLSSKSGFESRTGISSQTRATAIIPLPDRQSSIDELAASLGLSAHNLAFLLAPLTQSQV